MKARKGLTLVEIILSIAILGVISLVFLMSMTSHFTFLIKSKDISQNSFLAQKEMEEEIDIVKEGIRNNTLSLENKTILNNLGGIDVSYYEIEKEYKGKKYYTLVSDVKPEIHTPIKLKDIDIKIDYNAKSVPYGYKAGGFKVEGSFSNKDEHKWDHLLNVVEWYVASSDYISPIPNGLTLQEDEYYYPLFPRDYVIVDNKTIYNFGSHKVNFEKLEEYAGRHLVFTATAGAKSGRIGEQLISNPVFISGLPITENLIMHFDANFVNPLDSEETQEINGNLRVEKWFDLSSIFGREEPNKYANQNNIDKRPGLIKTEEKKEFRGQYVHFTGDESLTIKDTTTSTSYLLAVVRNRNKDEDSLFMINGNNEFKVPKDTEESVQDWKLVASEFTPNSQDYIIGGPNVDIVEIAIYSEHLDESKLNVLSEYFLNKYK